MEGEDEIIWALVKSGRYTPKEGYLVLANPRKPLVILQWWKLLWKLKVPPRSRVLMWCILKNKIPTGDNLLKRAFNGPHWCYFCNNVGESTSHIFLHCLIVCSAWHLVSTAIPSNCDWLSNSLVEALDLWYHSVLSHKLRNLPRLFC